MLSNRINGKTYCKYCGAEINDDSQFCKKCGKNFSQDNSLFHSMNQQINILTIFLGLLVSVVVLFIGSGLLGIVIMNKVMDVQLFIFLVLFFMLFLGGLTTGLLSSKSIKHGLINGGFLSLVFFVILGIFIGIYLFVIMGIATSIASAFSTFGSSTASIYPSKTTSSSPEDWLFIIKLILAIITSFFAGAAGGAVGSWIKEAIK